jgi:hypothetical protein
MGNLTITFSNHDQFSIDRSKLSVLLQDKFNTTIQVIGVSMLPGFVLKNFKWSEIENISTPLKKNSYAYNVDFSTSAYIDIL